MSETLDISEVVRHAQETESKATVCMEAFNLARDSLKESIYDYARNGDFKKAFADVRQLYRIECEYSHVINYYIDACQKRRDAEKKYKESEEK